MNILVWIGFCQSLFAAILMFSKKNSSLPDKILSGWLTLLSIDFLSCALNYEIFRHPLLTSSFLLFNPALYLYINSLTVSGFRIRWVQLLHLLPFVFFCTFTYVIKEPFALNSFFVHDKYFLFRVFFGSANIVSWLVYNPLSLRLIHKHRMHLHDELSNIEKNENLGWVLFVGIFYVVYCILEILIAGFTFGINLNPMAPHVFNYGTLLVLIYIMSFYGLRQTVVAKQLLADSPRIHYKNSNLSAEQKIKIKRLIISYFENGEAYLNPDLNMDLVSESLKIPKYQITEVLNTEIGSNFFQFVNHYRVEAVKRMLSNPKNRYSIEAIGYDCGFSSKSSFYKVFKDTTGKTPVTYRSSVLTENL